MGIFAWYKSKFNGDPKPFIAGVRVDSSEEEVYAACVAILEENRRDGRNPASGMFGELPKMEVVFHKNPNERVNTEQTLADRKKYAEGEPE